MNDYSIGALEAISWARAILRRCKKLQEFEEARKEVEDMLIQLASGAAVSFKKRPISSKRYDYRIDGDDSERFLPLWVLGVRI